MNNNFLAHIIRDLFEKRSFTIIYGADQGLRLTLLDPQHSIGAYQMHSERDNVADTFEYRFWEAGVYDPFLSYGEADLFVSINYNPTVHQNAYVNLAIQIKQLLKNGGKAFVVNPGPWAKNIKNIMTIDGPTTKEAKRYSMLRNQDVLVYENI